MNCKQIITHIVQEGDSFYNIAQYYQVPMEIIMEQNPGLDPYNLQVGTTLMICMDGMMGSQNPWEGLDWQQVMGLHNAMREVWSQHVYWTRMLMISIVQRLKDQMAVTNRLLENPEDITEIFAEFYPEESVGTLTRLLMEHLQIGSGLITALRDGRTDQATALTRQWYANADELASEFAGLNPQYQIEEVRQMLYRHLGLLQQMVAARLSEDFEADIEAFDQVEEEALQMADYFTSGLIMQFPQRF